MKLATLGYQNSWSYIWGDEHPFCSAMLWISTKAEAQTHVDRSNVHLTEFGARFRKARKFDNLMVGTYEHIQFNSTLVLDHSVDYLIIGESWNSGPREWPWRGLPPGNFNLLTIRQPSHLMQKTKKILVAHPTHQTRDITDLLTKLDEVVFYGKIPL